MFLKLFFKVLFIKVKFIYKIINDKLLLPSSRKKKDKTTVLLIFSYVYTFLLTFIPVVNYLFHTYIFLNEKKKTFIHECVFVIK